ncbi:transporter [Lacinutrix sp.]|uniref:transporter n=1 Tax=Lacinutrix sp. TaxID=1937692 RepID=UPI0025BBE928|nr:transporter [Lacinutrix sp.]
MKHYINALFLMATTVLFAQSNETENTNKWRGSRPDGHAPISVMGDHTHGKGEFMLSYRFMSMNMEGLKTGNNNVSPSSILIPNGGQYMVTPTRMPMDMHMLGLMYAPNNRVTLSVMANYMSMEMDHITAMGGQFATESSGFGDVKLGMLYKFFNKNKNQLHGNFSLSLPTGTFNNKDVTPASSGNEVVLPYPMQIGSGTFDATLGLTYLKQYEAFSFGSQLTGLLRIGENSNDYSLGNRYSLNNWLAFKANNWLSFSGRVEGLIVDEINGENPVLNPNMIITANTNNSGGTYINSGLGFNLYVPNGTLKNLRLGFEYATPFLQNVNETQLKTNETITFGLQYAF